MLGKILVNTFGNTSLRQSFFLALTQLEIERSSSTQGTAHNLFFCGEAGFLATKFKKLV